MLLLPRVAETAGPWHFLVQGPMQLQCPAHEQLGEGFVM